MDHVRTLFRLPALIPNCLGVWTGFPNWRDRAEPFLPDEDYRYPSTYFISQSVLDVKGDASSHMVQNPKNRNSKPEISTKTLDRLPPNDVHPIPAHELDCLNPKRGVPRITFIPYTSTVHFICEKTCAVTT